MNESLETKEDVIAWVHRSANEVQDPCGMARGLSIGMVDMGLIRSVSVEHDEDGWKVCLRIRFTSAGCFYFLYFERELRERLGGSPGIKAVRIDWDEVCDWTPGDLSESARAKLYQHHGRLLSRG